MKKRKGKNKKETKRMSSAEEENHIVKTWKLAQSYIASKVETSLPPHLPSISSVKYIGGLDISFIRGTDEAVACFVLLGFPSLDVIRTEYVQGKMSVPYVPGYLAFREMMLLSLVYEYALDHLPSTVHPDVIFIDGNGILHPRCAGLASHFGVLHNIPTIGVSKKCCLIDDGPNINRSAVREKAKSVLLKRGDYFELVGDSGKVYGAAVRSCDDTIAPIYVSIGHKVTLSFALELTKACTKSRVPQPTRLADIWGRDKIRRLLMKRGENYSLKNN